MNKAIVSVLMTSYNREKYIAEAIESVMAQTFTEWELIIVDDQSKDATVSIAKDYAKKDSRIKVYIDNHNLGDYPNRNQAASYATGKYLKYLDADDLLYPHALEVMINAMERYPECSWGLMAPAPTGSQPYPFMLDKRSVWHRGIFNGWRIFGRSPLSLIFTKEIFDKVGGFSGKQHVGDYELIHILSCKSPMVAFEGGLAWYRIHDDQQSCDNRTDHFVPFKYLKIRLDALKNLDIPLTSNELKIIEGQTNKTAVIMMIKELLHCNFEEFKKMKNHIGWKYIRVINCAIKALCC